MKAIICLSGAERSGKSSVVRALYKRLGGNLTLSGNGSMLDICYDAVYRNYNIRLISFGEVLTKVLFDEIVHALQFTSRYDLLVCVCRDKGTVKDFLESMAVKHGLSLKTIPTQVVDNNIALEHKRVEEQVMQTIEQTSAALPVCQNHGSAF